MSAPGKQVKHYRPYDGVLFDGGAALLAQSRWSSVHAVSSLQKERGDKSRRG
jgi:hypothetical protein